MIRFIFVALLLLLIACAVTWRDGSLLKELNTTSISTLVAHPNDYQGHQVTTQGIVIDGVALFGFGKYRIRDFGNDAVVDVVTKKAVPNTGSKITVTGQFKQALAVAGLQYDVIVAQ